MRIHNDARSLANGLRSMHRHPLQPASEPVFQAYLQEHFTHPEQNALTRPDFIGRATLSSRVVSEGWLNDFLSTDVMDWIEKRWDQAQPLYVQARDEMQDLADKNPSVLEYPVALAEILINMAQAELEQSRPDAALAGFERAQLLLMPLLAGAARNARYRGNLIVTLRAVGVLHPEASRRDESRQALRKLRAQLCEILTQSPQDRETAEQLQQLDETLELLVEVPSAASDTDPGSAAPPEHQHTP